MQDLQSDVNREQWWCEPEYNKYSYQWLKKKKKEKKKKERRHVVVMDFSKLVFEQAASRCWQIHCDKTASISQWLVCTDYLKENVQTFESSCKAHADLWVYTVWWYEDMTGHLCRSSFIAETLRPGVCLLTGPTALCRFDGSHPELITVTVLTMSHFSEFAWKPGLNAESGLKCTSSEVWTLSSGLENMLSNCW